MLKALVRIVAVCVALAGAGQALAGVWDERRDMCFECHGAKGASETPDTPSLGGLSEFYVLIQLVQFRDEQRKVPLMNEMAKGMSDDDLRAAAAYISKLPPPPPPKEAGDPEKMKRGAAIAAQNHCGTCHSADYSGQEQIPRLAHQREDYLLLSLKAYKAQERLGANAAMLEVVQPLSEANLADLAHYLAHFR